MKQYNNVTIKSGFTLVELLTIIAIIGILAGVVVVNVSSARARGRDAKRIADINATAQALEMYYKANKKYPVNGLCDSNNSMPQACWAGLWQGDPDPVFSVYLPDEPVDPNQGGMAWPTAFYYYYFVSSDQKKFAVDARLEKKQQKFDGTNCSNPNESSFYVSGIIKCSDDNYHYRVAGK